MNLNTCRVDDDGKFVISETHDDGVVLFGISGLWVPIADALAAITAAGYTVTPPSAAEPVIAKAQCPNQGTEWGCGLLQGHSGKCRDAPAPDEKPAPLPAPPVVDAAKLECLWCKSAATRRSHPNSSMVGCDVHAGRNEYLGPWTPLAPAPPEQGPVPYASMTITDLGVLRAEEAREKAERAKRKAPPEQGEAPVCGATADKDPRPCAMAAGHGGPLHVDAHGYAWGIEQTRPHVIDGEFQSDKYPTTPPGKVPNGSPGEAERVLEELAAMPEEQVDAELAAMGVDGPALDERTAKFVASLATSGAAEGALDGILEAVRGLDALPSPNTYLAYVSTAKRLARGVARLAPGLRALLSAARRIDAMEDAVEAADNSGGKVFDDLAAALRALDGSST